VDNIDAAFWCQSPDQFVCVEPESVCVYPCPISMFFLGRTTQHKGSFVIVKQVVYLCTTLSKREN